MDCVSVPFRRWTGKTKYWSASERGMVVGARCTSLCVSRTATVLGFSCSTFLCVSRMVHHPKDIQPTWHNCGKHWSQHGPAWNLIESMPRQIEAVLRINGLQLNFMYLIFISPLFNQVGYLRTSSHFQLRPDPDKAKQCDTNNNTEIHIE